jgi:hypothetical protein
MTISIKRTGLVSAIVALASVTACSNKQSEIDPSLKADLAAVGGSSGDLQLAPNSAKSNMVVSEIEGGPKAAPTHAATVRTPRPTPQKAPPAAEKQLPVNAPTHSDVAISAPASAAQPEQQPAAQAPRPAPAPAAQQDKRVYKTEAEIFRQMPWIRP